MAVHPYWEQLLQLWQRFPAGHAPGTHPWDYERIQDYIPPSNVYVCPVQGGEWEGIWPWRSGSNTGWSWSGYACFAGHAAHDITRRPVTPEGVQLATVRTPESDNRRDWRRCVPHRDTDDPELALAGDILTGWQETHFTTPLSEVVFTASPPPSPADLAVPRISGVFGQAQPVDTLPSCPTMG
jgi:hypothetical protein